MKKEFTTFDIKDIPTKIKEDFKLACKNNQTSMKDEVISFMKVYITKYKISKGK